MSITTHVLDTARGRPAVGVEVHLEVRDGAGWRSVGRSRTDEDGRARDLAADAPTQPGVYRLTFEVGAYFEKDGVESFHPEVAVIFRVGDAAQHYHVPLLVSPFGYTTYRGS
jgi:5-hydroxyisourate hydrolase